MVTMTLHIAPGRWTSLPWTYAELRSWAATYRYIWHSRASATASFFVFGFPVQCSLPPAIEPRQVQSYSAFISGSPSFLCCMHRHLASLPSSVVESVGRSFSATCEVHLGRKKTTEVVLAKLEGTRSESFDITMKVARICCIFPATSGRACCRALCRAKPGSGAGCL